MIFRPYHLVDCFDNLQHLVVADLSIAINVVELKGPVELVLHLPPRRHRQRTDEFLEVNRSGVVGVKHTKDIVGEFRWVSEREELTVDLLELFLREVARRTVLEEACRF